MTVILFIRHGENDYVKKGRLAGRLPGVHLNKKGQMQAQAVADRLCKVPIKAVYSSPLERTMETAEPLAKALGLEVIQRPGLVEIDFGEWQDKKLKGLSRLKVWRRVQYTPSLVRFPGGETFGEAQARIVHEIQELSALHEPKDLIACVTHSDVIKLAVAYFIGLPLDMFQRLHVAPGSISALALDEGSSRLLTLNYEVTAFTEQPEEKKVDKN
ncbi:MAG: phosphoglycerate mutase [Chloroflexi bacterium]|jgi:probable phosphomutase (TIGR03848 family)|nr:phosphoglycerate mutase [Chloroflexota bacterium]